ncbi:MAG TPA: winged helix-turn-helix domain-containing protein [Nitrososphaera sp.]|jgi:predicted transcriptional regulator|nr:winged helix-turn-helix domain-containing protein [Nitrososphaera sp.]
MKHRDRIEVISRILQIANSGGDTNVTKTKIMYKALLSYNQLQEHLIFLTERDFLTYDKETRTFKTTEKGLRFLQIYKKIWDMIKPSEEPYNILHRHNTTSTIYHMD